MKPSFSVSINKPIEPHKTTPITGDKVKLLPGYHHPSRTGREGEIISVDRGLYTVNFGEFIWDLDESEFELLNER